MLYQDFKTHQGRTITKWNHYFPIYERHFNKFVNQSVVFWEIGVFRGGSLDMWKRYFGPLALIIGIDIDPTCKKAEQQQVKVCIGNQSDTAFLQDVIDKYGTPDIILDDGSHQPEDICNTFNYMYGKLSKNGVYLVEDLHTNYLSEYNGGLEKEGTFIELCKELIDFLNARYNGLNRGFAQSTFSISFYDSIIAFEKANMSDDVVYQVTRPLPFGTGQDYMLKGDYNKAIKIFEDIIDSECINNEELSLAHQLLGQAYYKNREYFKAVDIFLRCNTLENKINGKDNEAAISNANLILNELVNSIQKKE